MRAVNCVSTTPSHWNLIRSLLHQFRVSTSKYDTDKLQNTHSLPWIYLFIPSTLRLGTNFCWSESMRYGWGWLGYNPLVGSYRLFSVSKQSLNIWWWSCATDPPNTLKFDVKSLLVSVTTSDLHKNIEFVSFKVQLSPFLWVVVETSWNRAWVCHRSIIVTSEVWSQPSEATMTEITHLLRVPPALYLISRMWYSGLVIVPH